MATTTRARTLERDAVLVETAHVRPMMGIEVLEPVPARTERVGVHASGRSRAMSTPAQPRALIGREGP